MTSPVPRPETIRQLQRAAFPAYALLAGIQLDLFSALDNGRKSAAELAEQLLLDADKLQAVMCALATTGLLSLEDGCFSNSPEAQVFLVKGRPDYLGDEFEAFSDRWAGMAKTAESVRTGKAQAKLDYSTMSKEELETFYMGNHSQSREAGVSLMSRFDFSAHRRLLDVAGGTGGLAIAIAEACTGLTATVVELPNVVPVTQRFIAQAEAEDRVEALSLDVTVHAPPGSYDVAVMKNFIPVVSRAQAQQALKNVAQSLEAGGTLYMVDAGILDDSRITPTGVVVNSLFFINVFDRGGARTEAERRQWLNDAGLVDVERSTLSMGLGVMTARKPA